MNTVLFVDDEPRILAGLRRMLWGQRDRWEMAFVERGEDALAFMATTPVDVVISDFRMPGMDGGQLLQAVRDRYPDTARLILSGHTSEADLLKAITTAHQFLHKPCDPDMVMSAVDRALAMRDELHGAGIRAEIGGIDALPTPPSVLHELLVVLESSDATIDDVATVLERDIALTATLLQLVNSAYFATAPPVSALRDAVVRLGIHTVRSIVLLSEVTRSLEHAEMSPPEWAATLNSFTSATGTLARQLARRDAGPDAFCGGVLAECGQLVFASSRPDIFGHHLRERASTGMALSVVESAAFGVTHARAGAYLLSLWGFPLPVVEAVGRHDQRCDPEARFPFDCVEAVQLAHAIVEHERGPVCRPVTGDPITDGQLDARGALAVVEQWRHDVLDASGGAAR